MRRVRRDEKKETRPLETVMIAGVGEALRQKKRESIIRKVQKKTDPL